MNLTGKKGIGNVLKIFLEICFYAGIIILIALPFVLNVMGFKLGASMFVIYPNGVILLIIAHKFIKLFDSLKNNMPFCIENTKIMKSAGLVSLIGALIWIIDLLYEIFLAKSDDFVFGCTLGFLAVLYFGVSIALYILSELFKQATEYKEENELTI